MTINEIDREIASSRNWNHMPIVAELYRTALTELRDKTLRLERLKEMREKGSLAAVGIWRTDYFIRLNEANAVVDQLLGIERKDGET